MKPALSLALGAWLLCVISACGSSPAAPAATVSNAPTPGALNLSGAWTGSGTDAQGPELLTWALTQTGSAVSGSAVMRPRDEDGSCGSCHKHKSGTVSGTLSGTTLTLTMIFAAGGNDGPTPICAITLNATASGVTADRIATSYTGDSSCEGPITDGTLAMAR